MSNENTKPGVGRRTLLKVGAAAGAATALSTTPLWAQPSTVPAIPEVTVRFGCFAVTNHAWTVLAAQKGFLKDVGITMEGGTPKLLRETQIVPQLQNEEIDIAGMFYGLMTQTLDRVSDIKPILVYSFFQGKSLLGTPNKGYKSVEEFIADGMSWDDAARAAMEQMRGKPLAVPGEPSTYPWNEFSFGLADMKMADAKLIPVEDPKIVQLAVNDQVDFAGPGGAVQIYQLRYQAGWKPIMTMDQQLKQYSGKDSPLNRFLDYDLIQTTQKYIDNNRDTVFRFCSAMYRTLAYIFGPDQTKALTEYAPFINANNGSSLDATAIKFIFEQMDPFFTWKDQERLWKDPEYALYYRNIYEPKIKQFIDSGAIKNQDYDLDNIFQAKSIWEEMTEQKAQADALMAKLDSSVSADRQALLDQAKAHYDGYNYLDAVRFLQAATA